VPFVVLEKNADVGGTWFENRYPGGRVDVPNHLYSYSFFQREDWPKRFSTQDVLLDFRPGVGIRLAPHHYTRDDEVDEVMARVRGVVDAER